MIEETDMYPSEEPQTTRNLMWILDFKQTCSKCSSISVILKMFLGIQDTEDTNFFQLWTYNIKTTKYRHTTTNIQHTKGPIEGSQPLLKILQFFSCIQKDSLRTVSASSTVVTNGPGQTGPLTGNADINAVIKGKTVDYFEVKTKLHFSHLKLEHSSRVL